MGSSVPQSKVSICDVSLVLLLTVVCVLPRLGSRNMARHKESEWVVSEHVCLEANATAPMCTLCGCLPLYFFCTPHPLKSPVIVSGISTSSVSFHLCASSLLVETWKQEYHVNLEVEVKCIHNLIPIAPIITSKSLIHIRDELCSKLTIQPV